MKLKRMIQRCAFLALVLVMTAGMPLAASAQEDGTPLTVDRRTFLARVYGETDHGYPRDGTTRAQYVQILYRAAGAPSVTGVTSFLDVDSGAEYADAVLWAEHIGALRLNLGRTFEPDALMTVKDAGSLLLSALSALGENAQQVANSVLAAYTGRNQEEDYALTPGALLALLDRMTAEESAAEVQFPAILETSCQDT